MKKILFLAFIILSIFHCYIFFGLKKINNYTIEETWEYLIDFYAEIPQYFLKTFSLTNKDKIDRTFTTHWETFKPYNKDSAIRIVNFTEIIPFDWDSLIYINYKYSSFEDRNSNELKAYMHSYQLENNNNKEWLYFIKNSKIVYDINLFMASDNEKGIFFCTNKDIIKRVRNNAKFHVKKKNRFFIIRDMTETYVPTWRYVEEDEF